MKRKPIFAFLIAISWSALIFALPGMFGNRSEVSETAELNSFSRLIRPVKLNEPQQPKGVYPQGVYPLTLNSNAKNSAKKPIGAPATPELTQSIQPSRSLPRETGNAVAPARPPISAEDLLTLRSLPPICTSDLPGLSGLSPSEVKPAQHQQRANEENIDQRVAQASANFRWPDFAPKDNSEDSFAQSPTPLQVANPINPHTSDRLRQSEGAGDGKDPHLEIYSRNAYPSARDCAQCHKQIYEEWANSGHAYASISPMFHAFENKINQLSQGTIGYFCLRCHAPVATTLGLRRDQAIWDGPRVFKEGVTCVACHRVKIPFTKADGERRMEPGGVNDPVYGSGDGTGVALADKYKQFFKIKTDPHDHSPGLPMHRRSIQFEELSKSTFCMSCHQVAVKPGIKLEVVWDQYRASPACKEGVSCQDCHMGKVPGVDEGYSLGPAAIVNDNVVNPERKHSNHMFFGPGYSIAHPGVFPDNLKADRWTFNEWLQFDWRAGWGTAPFENAIADRNLQIVFPEPWALADDRFDAREVIDENLKALEYKKDTRRQIMENGSKLDGPFFADTPCVQQPLNFRYCLTNTSTGHNMPSGSLGAQPQLWMNVVLIDPNGQRIWETGYLDSNGDLADNHSLDVLARCIPLDTQLMNLQTKFLTTNVKGTDREMYLPINLDIDQLAFLRPAQQPITVLNHPPLIRMEAHSIPALGSRNVKYSVPARLIQQPGTYRLSVRMRSRAEPIYFMRFCDTTPEMQQMMNEWIVDFHTQTVAFEIR